LVKEDAKKTARMDYLSIFRGREANSGGALPTVAAQ
jgi:hypothetical protein